MKVRGMIFNGEMVRAILDGRKTQTRRPANASTANLLDLQRQYPHKKYNISCPCGVVGDRLWVRETFQGPLFDYEHMQDYLEDSSKFETPEFCQYAADGKPAPEYYDADDNLHCGWRPSIHMPRWASRLTLEITGVRVERLNSISQEDAQAEGMELTGWRPTYSDPDSGGEVWTPYDNFAQLWESIYGEESWKANPWVWVIEFKVVPNVQDNPA